MTTPPPRANGPIRIAKALGAFIGLASVIIGLPLVFLALGTVPHALPTIHQITTSLRTRDDSGAYFQIAGAAALWIFWAIYTTITIKETLASIRFHGPRPSLPKTGLARLGPAALVATIAAVFVTAPITLGTPPSASAHPLTGHDITAITSATARAAARTIAPGATTYRIEHASAPHDTAPPPATHAPLAATAPTSRPPGASGQATAGTATLATADADTSELTLPRLEVQRYDTLWSIAEHHLPGNPAVRYQDIKDLNPTTVGPDNLIRTGQWLTLPADAYGLPANAPSTQGGDEVTVTAGDTLSGIAAEAGIPDWHTIWPANEGRTEPGGAHFTNPNHIEPGWHITIPTPAPPPAAPHSPTTPSTPPPANDQPPTDQPAPETPTPNTPSPPEPATPTTPSTTTTEDGDHHAPAPAAPQHAPSEHASWDAAFAGGAALLTAGLLTALLGLRRRQIRHRRPGRATPTTPTRTVPAEHALRAQAPRATADITFLDTALRHLSATLREGTDPRNLPDVLAARYRDEQLELHLQHPASNPPPPWTSDPTGTRWTLRATDPLPSTHTDVSHEFAPYPLLVAIGDDDAGGHWLLDLETIHTLVLRGDPDRCADFSRFLAAELAVNAWSDSVHVTLNGFEPELAHLNPARLTHEPDLTAAAATLDSDLDRTSTATAATGLHPLAGRQSGTAADAWMPRVLLVRHTRDTTAPDGLLDELGERLNTHPGRTAIALVTTIDPETIAHSASTADAEAAVSAPVPNTGGHCATFTADGRLLVPALDLDLRAHQLRTEHVRDLALLFAHAGLTSDQPMPDSTGTAEHDSLIDAAGAIRTGFTSARAATTGEATCEVDRGSPDGGPASTPHTRQPHRDPATVATLLRPTEADATGSHGLPSTVIPSAPDAVDDGSPADQTRDDGQPAQSHVPHDPDRATLLPAEDREYLLHAAATCEDLATLAPHVTPTARDRVLSADPRLDEDLADWRDPQSSTPKLRLLGPVELVATGTPPPRRLSYHLEIVAFLATRDHGTTVEQLAAAFDTTTNTIYKVINAIRTWLGTHPDTGEKYLPDSTRTAAGRSRGVGVYEIPDALVDADLFKRLRTRGEALGGDAGIADLQAALDLVIGSPFDQLRPGGYGWLAETPLDHYLTAAIVDVAHIVHLHHLHAENWQRAREIAELALRAAPYEDTPRLDLAAALDADGHHAAARQLVQDEVCNRCDDDSGIPDDLPERTTDILRQRGWGSRAS